jgi:hypothetical protein
LSSLDLVLSGSLDCSLDLVLSGSLDCSLDLVLSGSLDCSLDLVLSLDEEDCNGGCKRRAMTHKVIGSLDLVPRSCSLGRRALLILFSRAVSRVILKKKKTVPDCDLAHGLSLNEAVTLAFPTQSRLCGVVWRSDLVVARRLVTAPSLSLAQAIEKKKGIQ